MVFLCVSCVNKKLLNKLTLVNRNNNNSCDNNNAYKNWKLNLTILLFQFPRRFGPVRSKRLPADRTRYPQDASENHRYRRGALLIQKPQFQVSVHSFCSSLARNRQVVAQLVKLAGANARSIDFGRRRYIIMHISCFSRNTANKLLASLRNESGSN